MSLMNGIGNFTSANAGVGIFGNLASAYQGKTSSFLSRLAAGANQSAHAASNSASATLATAADDDTTATAVASTEDTDNLSAAEQKAADSLAERFALRDSIFDQMDLSDDTIQSIKYGKMMFELNIEVVQSVSSASGTSLQKTSFSLSGSMEYLQALSGNSGAGQTDNSMDSFMDFFSPEKTAGRILDFALGFFGQSQAFTEQGDTTEGRQAFSDYIGAAVQKGFDQAMGILGNVGDSIQKGIDDTHDIVFKGLDDFVKGLSSSASVSSADSSEDTDGETAQQTPDSPATSSASAADRRSWAQRSLQAAYNYSFSYSYSSTSYYYANASDTQGDAATAGSTPVTDIEAVA